MVKRYLIKTLVFAETMEEATKKRWEGQLVEVTLDEPVEDPPQKIRIGFYPENDSDYGEDIRRF